MEAEGEADDDVFITPGSSLEGTKAEAGSSVLKVKGCFGGPNLRYKHVPNKRRHDGFQGRIMTGGLALKDLVIDYQHQLLCHLLFVPWYSLSVGALVCHSTISALNISASFDTLSMRFGVFISSFMRGAIFAPDSNTLFLPSTIGLQTPPQAISTETYIFLASLIRANKKRESKRIKTGYSSSAMAGYWGRSASSGDPGKGKTMMMMGLIHKLYSKDESSYAASKILAKMKLASQEILSDILTNFTLPTTYLLVNALDEFKWLVTSRNLLSIKQFLHPSSISDKISLKLNAGHILKADKAEDTLLWVSLVCKCKDGALHHSANTTKKVRIINQHKELERVPLYRTKEVLRELPPGLDPLYNSSLQISLPTLRELAILQGEADICTLRRDMCNLRKPGAHILEVESQTKSSILPQITYAHWLQRGLLAAERLTHVDFRRSECSTRGLLATRSSTRVNFIRQDSLTVGFEHGPAAADAQGPYGVPSASNNQTIQLWDTNTGQPLQTLEGYTEASSAFQVASTKGQSIRAEYIIDKKSDSEFLAPAQQQTLTARGLASYIPLEDDNANVLDRWEGYECLKLKYPSHFAARAPLHPLLTPSLHTLACGKPLVYWMLDGRGASCLQGDESPGEGVGACRRVISLAFGLVGDG
ncbi:uncharacterized protein BDR25DRAFT_359865 [Lindgomyces ingoldianus]|uniref:Uncharacterized protein n=1 Tax=Lindgomyces ingoldianus TaxID=673940 RepID=A0ACB6QHU1_9PLEO|nr:uncharacterized protein BDR25DRAFT_359865 [Lindgomyces ingoldianus]KAF2466075.1 hypothetical protein BDR25DRAFT_359865 [Lindgomyces ingoldianus]